MSQFPYAHVITSRGVCLNGHIVKPHLTPEEEEAISPASLLLRGPRAADPRFIESAQSKVVKGGDKCRKCRETVLTHCECGTAIGGMMWSFDPDGWPQYYKRAQAGRDCCPKCGKTYEWSRRWLFKSRQQITDLSDYELDLITGIREAPQLPRFGLECADLANLYITRPLVAFLFGARHGGVSLRDPRHPKHSNWLAYTHACSEFLQNERGKRGVDEAKRQLAESFWHALDGRSFETEFARFLRDRGFKVRHVGGPGDGGADLILEISEGQIIIQCKAHKHKIGPGTVRDLYGAVTHRKVLEGWIVCLKGYSASAVEFAAGKNIELLTISDFLRTRC